MIPFFILSRKSLKQLFITLLILLFSSITIYSQTVIKERVGIQPNSILRSITSDSTDWDIYYGDLCNGSTDSFLYFQITSTNERSPYYALLQMEINSDPDVQFVDFWRDIVVGKTLTLEGVSFTFL